MALPEFEDLPFYDRPDLTPYLVHLTKNSKKEERFFRLSRRLLIISKKEKSVVVSRARDSLRGRVVRLASWMCRFPR